MTTTIDYALMAGASYYDTRFKIKGASFALLLYQPCHQRALLSRPH